MDAKFFMKPIHLTNSQIINLVELLVDYKFDEQEKVGTKYILKIKQDVDFDSGFHFILEYKVEVEGEDILINGAYEGSFYDTSYETDVPNKRINVNVNRHSMKGSVEALSIDIKGVYEFLTSIGYWESKEIELEENIDILPFDCNATEPQYKIIYTSI